MIGFDALLRDPCGFLHRPVFCLALVCYTITLGLLLAAVVRQRPDWWWLGKLRRLSLLSWLFLTAGILLKLRAAYLDVSGSAMWPAVGDVSILAWLSGTALLHAIRAGAGTRPYTIVLHRRREAFRQTIAILLTATVVLGVVSLLMRFPTENTLLQSLGKLPLIAALAVPACMVVCPNVGREANHSVRGLTAAIVAFLLLAAIMFIRKTPWPAVLAFSMGAALAASVASDIWHVVADRSTGRIRLAAGRAAHLGFAILVIGAVGIGALGTREAQPAKSDMHIFAGNYMVQFRGMNHLFTAEFVLSNDQKGFREPFSPAVGEVVHTDAAVLQLEAVDFKRKTARFSIAQTTRIDGDDIAYGPAEEMEVSQSHPLTLNDGTVLEFTGMTRNAGPDVVNLIGAQLDVYRTDRRVFEKIATLRPEVVVYAGSDRPQSRAAIRSTLTYDLCTGLTMHPQLGPVITVALRPFAIWAWIGGIIALGSGTVALLTRRRESQNSDS